MQPRGVNWVSRILAGIVVLLVVAVLVLTVRVLLVPLVAATFLVYLFEPGIEILQRRGMQRGRAYLLILGTVVIASIVLISLAPSWLDFGTASHGSTKTLTERLEGQLKDMENWKDRKLPMLRVVQLSDKIAKEGSDVAEHVLKALPGLLTSFIANLILVPTIAFFMVRDGRAVRRRIVELVPNRYFEMALIMFHRIDEQIGGYFRGRLVECILVGLTQILLMGLASVFVDQPKILLISLVCGVTNLIPYAGPVMGAGFGVFYYYALDLPASSVWALLIVAAAAHVIDNVIIAPAVLSHNVDLHPMIVALVLVIGGEVLGILGLLIAIPVASTIKVVVQEFYANYQAQVR
jgi:predicted PurR-regulated permease PerM